MTIVYLYRYYKCSAKQKLFTQNMLHKIILLFLFLTTISFGIHAQKDSTKAIKDSIKNDFLVEQSKQLLELENTRLQDSIKKAELQKKISDLSTVDNYKKKELIEELAQLKIKDSLRLTLKHHKIDSLRTFVKGYAVSPFLGDTLFAVYVKSGSLPASERANAVSNRIKLLAENYLFTPDSLQIIPSENATDIVFGEIIIISISESDALWENTSSEELATKYKDIICEAVMNYKKATSFQTIAKQSGLALLVLVILGTLIYGVSKLFSFIQTKIELQKGKKINGIKISNYELFTIDSQLKFLLTINTIIKWIVIFTAVYLTLPVLFSIFPWTEGFADTLFSYFLKPITSILFGVWEYLPNFVTITVIFFVFKYIIKGFHYLKTEIAHGALSIPGFFPDWANPTYQIIKVLLYAFMFIVIFPYLPGSDSPVFQGVSVFLGVLFTFGSSGSLSNVVAGLVLTYMRAFKIGDRVKIGDITGDIIEKSLLVTRIRTTKNEIISIPNSNVMGSHTINYSSDSKDNGLILHTTVTLGYDVPWKLIHQTLLDAADRTDLLLKTPKPFVLQTSLDDFYVSYQINAYTREANKQAGIYSQLHQNIQDCCNENNIEILSPHYRAARDGNMSTIPSDYLAKDYKAPSFSVKMDTSE